MRSTAMRSGFREDAALGQPRRRHQFGGLRGRRQGFRRLLARREARRRVLRRVGKERHDYGSVLLVSITNRPWFGLFLMIRNVLPARSPEQLKVSPSFTPPE